jgi:hypothetical protein
MRSFRCGDKVLLGNCQAIFAESEKYKPQFIRFTEENLKNESLLTIWKIDIEENKRLCYLKNNKESCETAYYEQELCLVENAGWDE